MPRLGQILGAMALGAGSGALDQITDQYKQRQQQTSDLLNMAIKAGVESGNTEFISDPNFQKMMKSSGMDPTTFVPVIQQLGGVSKALRADQEQERKLKIQAMQTQQQERELQQTAQQYVPGVVGPVTEQQRPDTAAERPAPIQTVERPRTTAEMRSAINALPVDARTKRAVLADPLVQSEFQEAFQRDQKASDQALRAAIAEASNQARITAAMIAHGGKTQDDFLKNVPMSTRAELIAMAAEDKARGGSGDLKPEWVGPATERAFNRRVGYMNRVIQQHAEASYHLAEQKGDLVMATNAARTFISKYSKDATSLNELQAHGKHFRDLMTEFSTFIRSSNIPAKDKTNLLQMPVAEAAKKLQWGKLGELTTLIQTYRAPLAILESRLAFGLGARNPQETREKVEESLPSITDRAGIIIGKMNRMNTAIGRIAGALDDERKRAREMLIAINPKSKMIGLLDRGEHAVLDETLKNYSAVNQQAADAARQSATSMQGFQILGVEE